MGCRFAVENLPGRGADMDTQRVREAVVNPELIRGIYTYCDRWCERCTLSARCAVFAMKRASPPHDHDHDNEAFWRQLEDTLGVAMDLLVEAAGECGVDLDALFTEEDVALEQRVDAEVQAHPLVRMAAEYLERVREWFDVTDGNLDETLNETALGDDERVILHYHTLIWTKINRAVCQLFESEPPYPPDLTHDVEGSAKVALIATDRSIAAWWRMPGQLPGHKGHILKCLVILARLREATERTFVNARDFVRPGFDEAAMQQ